MANPSGYNAAFLVMERINGRLRFVDAFPSGNLAEEDAARRFSDTGKDYSIAQFLADADDITQIINNLDIENIQTVFNFPFRPLPLKGDDSAGTPLTVAGFPVMRLNKNASDYITWTRRAPAGGASGIRFQFAWTPDGSANGNVKFRVTFNSFASGVLLTDITPEEVYLDLASPPHAGMWTQNKVYINTVAPGGGLENVSTFNIRLEFIGTESTVNKNINVLNCAINYQGSASGV